MLLPAQSSRTVQAWWLQSQCIQLFVEPACSSQSELSCPSARQVIPVMSSVLSPYLKGGGAASIDFQVSLCADCPPLNTAPARPVFVYDAAIPRALQAPCAHAAGSQILHAFWSLSFCNDHSSSLQTMSRELLTATLDIPFSVPPYTVRPSWNRSGNKPSWNRHHGFVVSFKKFTSQLKLCAS